MKSDKKRRKDNGSLNEKENIAPCDYRGKEHAVKSETPKAPDGIAGDWR